MSKNTRNAGAFTIAMCEKKISNFFFEKNFDRSAGRSVDVSLPDHSVQLRRVWGTCVATVLLRRIVLGSRLQQQVLYLDSQAMPNFAPAAGPQKMTEIALFA
jgi:hypothetical protein